MQDAQFWVFGFGRKSPAAVAEANAGLPHPITQPSREIPDYAPGALERLRARWSTAPVPTLYFGAPSVRLTTGGIAVRCNERSIVPVN